MPGRDGIVSFVLVRISLRFGRRALLHVPVVILKNLNVCVWIEATLLRKDDMKLTRRQRSNI